MNSGGAKPAGADHEAESADTPPVRGRRRRVIRPGTETSGGGGSTADDRPAPDEQTESSDDARLRREVPPHWA